MAPTSLRSAFAAASFIFTATMASAQMIEKPSTTVPMNALTFSGCYATPAPLIDHGPYIYQSQGNCQGICYELQKPVMGLSDGNRCYCGDLLPPATSLQPDNSTCNTPCVGYDPDICGANGGFLVFLSGITKNKINNFDPANPSGSGIPSNGKSGASVVTVGGSTVVMTVPGGHAATGGANGGKSGGPSKAGIAAGAVVGVVALGAIIVGVWLFLRNKRRKDLEEDHRRQAAVNQFVNNGKSMHTSNSSLTDARLDPESIMHRRQSDGSIMDNQDYSRRILKVTNPDGM